MLKKYRSTALAVSVITAMACLKYALFQGGGCALSPWLAGGTVKQDAGAELVYADDSFQLYFFPTENGPARWPMSNAWASGSRITPATGASPPPAR